MAWGGRGTRGTHFRTTGSREWFRGNVSVWVCVCLVVGIPSCRGFNASKWVLSLQGGGGACGTQFRITGSRKWFGGNVSVGVVCFGCWYTELYGDLTNRGSMFLSHGEGRGGGMPNAF